MQIDPVTLAVVRGWLQQITDEMDDLVCYAAFSPTISEGYDRASGIYRADTGAMIAQGKTGLPVFIEVMEDAVRIVNKAASRKGGYSEGDIYIMNDPYFGGSHLMDVKFFKLVFRKGKISYMLANTGHWPDIGGSAPGGFGGGSREIFQEGVLIPPLKLYDKGKLNEELLELLLSNVRIREERLGDLKAQVGALRKGEERLNSLLDKYGDDTVAACVDELERRADMALRSHIAEIPDGKYSYTDYIDNDGVEDKPIRITVEIEIKGSDITFDFSKSSPPVKGNVNSGYSIPASVCKLFLKHLFPDIPINAGSFKSLKIIVPETTFLNVSFPKAVAGLEPITERVASVLTCTMAQALPKRLFADSGGTINNLTIGGEDPIKGQYVMYVFSGVGYGGHGLGDGFTYGVPMTGSSRVQPYEVFEQLYPVRTLQFAINEESAGAGKFRGGFGAIIEFEFLGKEARLCLMGERGKFAPPGILGGKEAAKNEVYIVRKNGEKFVLPLLTKGETYIYEGDRVILKTPGGGGYGDPHERDRGLILADIVKGYIRKEIAEREYDVTISDEEIEQARLNL